MGIAIGVALLFASQVANTSLNGSVRQLTSGIVGQLRFQLAARDSHGFDEGLLRMVAGIPGVRAAVPVVEENVNVVGPKGQRSVDLIGTDPRFASLGGHLVRHFATGRLSRAKVFTLPASIAQQIGESSLQPVKLQIGARVVPALLVPQLISKDAGNLERSPIAIAPLLYAQKLTGMEGRLTSIFVKSKPGKDSEVRAGLARVAAGVLNVRPANFNATLFSRAAAPTNQSTGLFSAISALVGFLFAFNALLLTVPQRRNLIEDLRLDGYTRKMILEVLLFDALILGLVASLIGLTLGDAVSLVLFRSNPGYLSFAFPIGTQRIVTWQSVVLAVGGGMLAACVGVLSPLRGETFSHLGQFFGARARSLTRRRQWLTVAGLASLGLTTIIVLAAARYAIVGILSLTASLLCFLPVLLDLVVLGFDRLQSKITGASPYLAVIELRSRSNRARSIAIAATGAIAVFGSVAIQGSRGDLQRGLDASAFGIDSLASIWVTPSGTSNSFATTPFKDTASGALAHIRGVSEVRLYHGSFLDWRDRRLWIVAPPRAASRPLAGSQLVRGDLASATARIRAVGWAVVSQALASEHHLRIGQPFMLPSPRPTTLRLAGMITNLGWPPGAIILNGEDYARAWGSDDPSAYQIELSPGASVAQVSGEVTRALGPRSGLRVETAVQRVSLHYSQAVQGLSRLTQIRTLVLIAAVLAMAAAMGAMIWQRRIRLADMKVDGFSRGVLWRALLWESGLLLGAGCSMGVAFGLYGQRLLSRALSAVSGFPVVQSVDVPAALASFALVTAAAVVIVAVPGYLAARVRPAVSLQD